MFESFARHRRTANDASTAGTEVALLISTYQKPRHLKLVLASVALQQGVEGRLEVVVANDGSTDDTPQIVERFARGVAFPVKQTTHRRREFQVARCRNEAVAASSAPYLIILDGDCIIPPDFVVQHLRRRRRRVVMNGDCYRLEEEVSARIDEAAVRSGEYVDCVSAFERERIERADRDARWQNLIHHRRKPHLLDNNIGVWRSDLERVNGFDEDFVGWGNEDDDLGYRLRQDGIRIQSVLRWAKTYHVWHPRDATWTPNWHDGPNVARLFRKNRATRCVNGLVKLDANEAELGGAAAPPPESDATRIIAFPAPGSNSTPLTGHRLAA
jgi:glycosyltransferase involved in cell wall biosynthesis